MTASLSTTYPLIVTVNIANTKRTDIETPNPQQTIVHTVSAPISRQPALPSTENIKTDATNPDARLKTLNQAIANKTVFNKQEMNALLSRTLAKYATTSFGLEKLLRIGNHLFIKTNKYYHKLCCTDIDEMRLILSICSHFACLCRKTLKCFKTEQEALNMFQKRLGTAQFNDILSTLIAAVHCTETNDKLKGRALRRKRMRHKKKKKKNESKSVEAMPKHSDVGIETKMWEIKDMEEFTSYGIFPEPPMKKRKVSFQCVQCCVKCKKQLNDDSAYKCSKCKRVVYCDAQCEEEHRNEHGIECVLLCLEDTDGNKDTERNEMIKNERNSVHYWNWYSIIYWLNRVKNGRFNDMKYLKLRRHIFIGEIKGHQLCGINDITLNMIGISDYNQHQLILNAVSEL